MTQSPDTITAPARRLAATLEPFAGQVYFAPECHKAYEALGFGPSPATVGATQMPDRPAYFCSRGSCLGQVPGEVVAATFAVFNPAVVVPAVEDGWTKTDAAAIARTRAEASTAHLTRVLGATPAGLDRAIEFLRAATEHLRPEGRALYSGLVALGMPGTPVGDAWRLADMLREYRGDAHIAAWVSAGFDAPQIGLLTELYWGLPMRTYIRTRSWTDADLDVAEDRLRSRGLVSDGALTAAGREQREQVEVATDRQCAPIVDALGAGLDELIGILRPWGDALRQAGGYPAGPRDLAASVRR
ncbi:MAG: SCO6745 family protein [Acidimicrobiales bacterium]